MAGWRKACEATSPSPSGLHFSHYMAGTFNPTVAVFNARLANLGFTTGYSLKRWQKGLNVLLEKQPGNLNVEKLCIILLFEGNFNNNNKWLIWAIMFHAEDHNQMAPEQYGSHKEKSAAIQCLNKWLLYNYVWCNHIPMALYLNDAKSCYNRIILIVVALCLCCLGADKASVQSMIGTIHGMRHHVWSTFGDLKVAHRCKEWRKPITGISQGNGAGPQIWAAVSTPLFQILAEEGLLATIICTVSIHARSLVSFGFIDDTDLCITAPDNRLPTVLHRMQQSLQMWANLLHVMGGALVSEKSFWYF